MFVRDLNLRCVPIGKELKIMQDFSNRIKINEDFFKELYKKYFAKLCRFVYYYLNSKDLAEETVQDFFTALWDKRSTINIDNNLESYLFVSVRNIAFSKSRKEIRINYHKDELIKESDYSPSQFNEELFNRRLKSAIEKLPEKCRLIYCLKYMEGLTHDEIAQYLEISEKTIETQIYRALLKLRKELAPFKMEFYNT